MIGEEPGASTGPERAESESEPGPAPEPEVEDLDTEAEAEAEAGAEPETEAAAKPKSRRRRLLEKARAFPDGPGVYLLKDARGRVVYVGKAKRLRARAASYFQRTALDDPRIRDWIGEVDDVECLSADSEVDAMLMEARLIKDIQPRRNKDLKDDKSFPYLQITTNEDFPRVNFTRQPSARGVKLYGPFPRARQLRGAIQVLQRIFKFRTCTLDIDPDDPRWRWFRPCLLESIGQCSAPCNLRIDRETYRRDVRRLRMFLDGKREAVSRELEDEMREAARALQFEKAARLRDALRALRNLDERGNLEEHAQPEVFQIDPKRGLAGLRKILRLEKTPRRLDAIDIAHLGGSETVGSLVTFVDGLPFKPGYRRYRIRTVRGIDDFASIREVVARRIEGARSRDEPWPDILLIDGGRGQLNAARDAFRLADADPPTLIGLAKREEEIYTLDRDEPIRLDRRSFALRLLQYARDEAHRFARHYHHLLRHKKMLGEGGAD